MYKLIYYAETRDLNEVPLRVEIYRDTDLEVQAQELELAGESPIIVSYDGGGDIFKPLIQSSATIAITTEHPLLDLYTGKLNEITVKILRNGDLFWYGFLTPNIYSQDYEAASDRFELEFIDTIAQMDNVRFENTGFFKTFDMYIASAITEVDKMAVIRAYIMQGDLPIDMRTMGVMMRNFIDETDDDQDGAMTQKEVLESIMMWIGKTMFQWGDTLYLLDMTNLDSAMCERHDFILGIDAIWLPTSVQGLLDQGINGAACSISLGDVYNKATIIANTNQISNVLPSVLDDSSLESIMPDGVNYITKEFHSRRQLEEGETEADRTFMLINAYFCNSDWAMPYGWHPGESIRDPLIWWDNMSQSSGKIISQSNIEDVRGTYVVQRYADYCVADGEPATLNWKKELTLGDINFRVLPPSYRGDEPFNDFAYIRLANRPNFVGLGGYFIFSMSYFMSNQYIHGNTAPFAWTPETYGQALPYQSTDTDCDFRDDIFQLELQIGDKYFNGESWTTTPSQFTVKHKNQRGDRVFGSEKSIDNTVSYTWNLAKARDGYAIPLPANEVLSGELSLKLWPDTRVGGTAQVSHHGVLPWSEDAGWYYDGLIQNVSPILTVNVTQMEMVYTTTDTVEDVFNLEEYDPDITYTNIIDEANVTKMDDITFTTNTYSPHAVSYSYVIQDQGNDSYTFVREISGKIQEERILEKLVDHYKTPKLVYKNNLNADGITPWTRIRVPSLGKNMVANSIEFDLAADRAGMTLIEA